MSIVRPAALLVRLPNLSNSGVEYKDPNKHTFTLDLNNGKVFAADGVELVPVIDREHFLATDGKVVFMTTQQYKDHTRKLIPRFIVFIVALLIIGAIVGIIRVSIRTSVSSI